MNYEKREKISWNYCNNKHCTQFTLSGRIKDTKLIFIQYVIHVIILNLVRLNPCLLIFWFPICQNQQTTNCLRTTYLKTNVQCSRILSSRPSSTSSSRASQAKALGKPKKTIDLGAAATYAAQAKPVQNQPPVKAQTNVDLFGNGDQLVQQPPKKSVDLFNAEDDDFNPRGGAKSGDANANGDFGDFESAFGGGNGSNNHTTSSAANGSAFKADFANAFGSSTTSTSSKLPGPPTPPPTAAASDSIDLFGGSSGPSMTQGPSSNLDLLGGLVMNNPPPLMGVAPPMGGGAMTPMGNQQQNDLFGGPTPVMMLGGQQSTQEPKQPPMLVTGNIS